LIPPALRREDALSFLGWLTHKASMAALERKLKGTGLSPVQYLALGFLMSPEPMIQSDLAESLSITVPTCVRLIDRLERDGFVTRQADPRDARMKLLRPTAKGAELWQEIGHLGPELLAEAYDGVSVEEIDTVKRVLTSVRQNYDRVGSGRETPSLLLRQGKNTC
jgi:MarR family transcriptional regulator for hemolysin